MPTRAPTPRPTAEPQPAADNGPAQAVRSFYAAVVAEDFDRAAALWTAEMRQRYPPDEYLDGRFAPTTRIDILGIRTIERSGNSARVGIAIREFRTDENGSRVYEGAWDLVRRDGRWLLADPDLRQTG